MILSTVLFQYRRFGLILNVVLLGHIFLFQGFQLGRFGKAVHVQTLAAGLPGEELRSSVINGVARNSNEIVTSIVDLVVFPSRPFIGVLAHRSSFGIVVGRVRVEVSQVLGGVLTDSEVTNGVSFGSVDFGSRHVHLLDILVLIVVATGSTVILIRVAEAGVQPLPLDILLALVNLSVLLQDFMVSKGIIAVPSVSFAIKVH